MQSERDTPTPSPRCWILAAVLAYTISLELTISASLLASKWLSSYANLSACLLDILSFKLAIGFIINARFWAA
jgi:hypothetical protein